MGSLRQEAGTQLRLQRLLDMAGAPRGTPAEPNEASLATLNRLADDLELTMQQ